MTAAYTQHAERQRKGDAWNAIVAALQDVAAPLARYCFAGGGALSADIPTCVDEYLPWGMLLACGRLSSAVATPKPPKASKASKSSSKVAGKKAIGKASIQSAYTSRRPTASRADGGELAQLRLEHAKEISYLLLREKELTGKLDSIRTFAETQGRNANGMFDGIAKIAKYEPCEFPTIGSPSMAARLRHNTPPRGAGSSNDSWQ